MAELVCGLPDELFADLPTVYRRYTRWIVDEVDDDCPYHDALDLDDYSPEIPDMQTARRYGVRTIALMCDATYGFAT